MAEIMTDDVMTYGKKFVVISGSFRPNAGSAVDNTLNTGIGFTVARTSQGLFTITLSKRYFKCISATATLQLASAGDQYAQIGNIAVAITATNTVEIRVWDVSDAGVADIASNANNKINFCLVLKNSSAPGITG